MKVRITESQFNRLFEVESPGDSKFLDGTDTTKKFSSEVSGQAVIHDEDGEEKESKPVPTDKVSRQLSKQQWGVINGRNPMSRI